MKKLLFLFFISVSSFLYGAEYTVETIPNPKTQDANAYVSNPDGILKQETVSRINVLLDSLEAQNGSEVAVVAVNSIGYEDIKSFATTLFKTWGIGKSRNNNGLLVLFVLDQRKVTFETGYGLEGVLPDAISKRIQTQSMIPEFKNGNYDAGILAGVERIVSTVKNEPFETKAETPIAWNEILPLAAGVYLILIILSLVWVSNIVRKIRKDARFPNNLARYKAIKSEKTGVVVLISVLIPVIAFVAILLLKLPLYLLVLLVVVPFTTIPANIYGKIMMRKIRREPIQCNECEGKMHILSEKQEDAHLKLAQQFEEQLQAIDYDVFVCDNCKNEAIFTLDKPSAYSECPKCGTKAFILKDKRTVVAPTYISAGTERTTYHCKFCGYEEHHNNNIPRLQRNSGAFVGGAVAGSLFSGRGGFGGGGGFSGGSFGGGMSGGGGSTSGW
ncbi:MAG: TPM domain-containing protein [Paludibacter sp.]